MLTSRRPSRVAAALLVTALAAAGCVDSRLRSATSVGPLQEVPQPEPPKPSAVGTGSVKVALILPLTGSGQGAVAGQSLRNAAELSLSEFQGADLALIVKDDRGTADGAREAATQAVAEGAELIIGPLFAPSVVAAGQVARGAGKPVIAFSTDTGVAKPGIYLLSFTPQPEVERVIDYAAGQGRKSLAALIPDTVYGNVVEAEFREAAARHGLRVAAVERYAAGQPAPAVARIASVVAGDGAQADALFLPDSGDGLAAASAALIEARFNPGRVKPLGTGVWNDSRSARLPALQGGWYAAPDQAGFASFAGRYRAKYGSEPTRIATLAYDAVSLAAALTKTQGPQRFSESVLQGGTGFSGVDGTFRFRADGTNDRTLAVVEIRASGTSIVSPAPRVLGSGT